MSGYPAITMPALAQKWDVLGDRSPVAALKRANQTKWLVDGIIPAGSIAWMVAAPQSFKTFIALDMAACVASGRPWQHRETDKAVVLYLAAEGGDGIHIRRAAIDIEAEDTGPLSIVQMRPRLDEAQGLALLLGLVYGATGGRLDLPEVRAHMLSDHLKYLTPEERAEYTRRKASDDDEEHDSAMDFAQDLAAPRFDAWDAALEAGYQHLAYPGPALAAQLSANVLLVVDTYSQTSADDAKATVSRYIKTLRDLQEKAAALGGTVTVLIIDHTTKSGESYMGSAAKEGDSDVMLEVDRHGNSHGVTVKCSKVKDIQPFEPIHLEMKPLILDGFADAQGRPLASLVVTDGTKAHRIRKAAGANADTAAAVLLGLLDDAGTCTEAQLRQSFTSHPTSKGKSADAIRMAFRRAFDALQESGALEIGEAGNVSASIG